MAAPDVEQQASLLSTDDHDDLVLSIHVPSSMDAAQAESILRNHENRHGWDDSEVSQLAAEIVRRLPKEFLLQLWHLIRTLPTTIAAVFRWIKTKVREEPHLFTLVLVLVWSYISFNVSNRLLWEHYSGITRIHIGLSMASLVVVILDLIFAWQNCLRPAYSLANSILFFALWAVLFAFNIVLFARYEEMYGYSTCREVERKNFYEGLVEQSWKEWECENQKYTGFIAWLLEPTRPDSWQSDNVKSLHGLLMAFTVVSMALCVLRAIYAAKIIRKRKAGPIQI